MQCIWVSKVVCPCLGSCRATGTTPPTFTFCTVTDFDALCSALHIDIIERATIAGPAQHFWAAGCPIFSPPAPFTVSVALAANRAGADGVGIQPALGQQSTRFDQFELHHSIVYTTFLSPQVAAEYGITRGADKAILTLSVRDANVGEIAGRPMSIEGRTWDLITGEKMRIKEIREGRATYYIVPFEFLDREYRF